MTLDEYRCKRAALPGYLRNFTPVHFEASLETFFRHEVGL
jgi:hypothetical protein